MARQRKPKKPVPRNPVARALLTTKGFHKRVVEDKRRKDPKHRSTVKENDDDFQGS